MLIYCLNLKKLSKYQLAKLELYLILSKKRVINTRMHFSYLLMDSNNYVFYGDKYHNDSLVTYKEFLRLICE